MPQTLERAKSLTHIEVMLLVRRVICDLEGIDDADIDSFDINPKDGSPLVESQLGVEVFNELTEHLSETPIRVSGIEEWRWSSVDGLASAVEIALGRLKA
ncbi:hypothetical protein [Marisediminicola sp. LYQ134]|uniref:hypothetical protein n=1 Tax=Marisediminicola sp. LYQ134 TaxID=3391061 RepID=UPI0039831133